VFADDLKGFSLREARLLAANARSSAHGRGASVKLTAVKRLEEMTDRAERVVTQNEFGYVVQICEVTENTKRGARGFIVPTASKPGNPSEARLLPDTISELKWLGLRPREVALDGGFEPGPTSTALEQLAPDRTFIAGRQQPGTRRTQRRLARYRTGAEGRISHLKRGYGMRRSRLKGEPGMTTWTAWAILAYNLDTLAIRTS